MSIHLLSGTLFGSALLYAGVSSPTTILSQLTLSDFSMLNTFMAASMLSTLVATFSPALLPARGPAPRLSLFSSSSSSSSRYSANLLGGALQGLGMALSGACPGTGLVQAGVGTRGGWAFVGGGLVGAWAYRGLAGVVQRPASKPAEKEKQEQGSTPTLASALSLSHGNAFALYMALRAAVLCLSVGYAPPWPSSSTLRGGGGGNPVGDSLRGGLAIGAAQAASVLLRGALVGVSGGYAQAVDYLLSLFSTLSPSPSSSMPKDGEKQKEKKKKVDTSAAQFALGVALGGALLAFAAPGIGGFGKGKGGGGGGVRLQTAFLGGILQIFGARLAGGCTSGHGISGLATGGLASFVTVGANFATGVAATAAFF